MAAKDNESALSAPTAGVDPNVRAILDTIQKQNEKHEQNMNEIRRALNLASEENKRRVREIETLGRSLADLRMGVGSASAATEDFNSLVTDDDSATTAMHIQRNQANLTRQGEMAQKGRGPPKTAPATGEEVIRGNTFNKRHQVSDEESDEPEEAMHYSSPTFNAKNSINFIYTKRKGRYWSGRIYKTSTRSER